MQVLVGAASPEPEVTRILDVVTPAFTAQFGLPVRLQQMSQEQIFLQVRLQVLQGTPMLSHFALIDNDRVADYVAIDAIGTGSASDIQDVGDLSAVWLRALPYARLVTRQSRH
jgi:hypothetical protein